MINKLIFVSCGQLTEKEKNIGRLIKSTIDDTNGYEAYFADYVQSLSALGEHIFDALRRCSGAVVVLSPKGRVLKENGEDLGIHSSVWVNQEIAILAYRQFFEANNIPILAFKHDSVQLEGAMTTLIINQKPLIDEENVINEVRTWLQNEALQGKNEQQNAFDTKWVELNPMDKQILEALIVEGAHSVKDKNIRKRLINNYSIQQNQASNILLERKLFLSQMNLIQLKHNLYNGYEMSIHPKWEWYVRYAVNLDKKK